MKNLKLFEEFQAGRLYVSGSTESDIEVDGIPVKIVNTKDVTDLKSIYNIISISSGVTHLDIRCFSELDDAKNHISHMIKGYQNPSDGGDPIEVDSFIIKKAILDLKSNAPVNAKDSIKDVNSTKIYDHIEKNINVLVDAYLAISPQKYKATFTKDIIRKGLVRLQQECKFKDLSRTKKAIKVFNDSMKPMMDDVLKSKNIDVWKMSYNGKKYYSVFNDFTTMVNI